MSALSLTNQFPIRSLATIAGGAVAGTQSVVFNQAVPAGTYIGSVTLTLAGVGVTGGDISVVYDGVAIGSSIIGAVGANATATSTFFFESNGVDHLSVAVVGDGANWTSPVSAVRLRQIA